ncbi:MAG: type I-U CRISPR-associated protein Cas8c [Deltaproteobacteria bacterium]|nr:type I-U CRISPR-associated protein Cas8c [Deltaproteobacteria bacterium]
MAETSIPVDLFNPGQVFACLGFLEAADVLCGDAEGGFDWSDESRVRFMLRADGNRSPFEVVLEFLAEAEIHRRAPIGYSEPLTKKKASSAKDHDEEDSGASQNLRLSESFPNREGDRMALPIRLESSQRHPIDLGHWADGSSRDEFKLYLGNRSAHSIACAMLRGTREKPKKNQRVGDIKTRGIAALWDQQQDELTAKPFDVLTLMGGSFNFDPRGAWTAIDAGYSPNQHKHGIAASPVVEILAAWGLEHARPDEYETRQVRYSVWSGLVPPILARPALAGASVAVPVRRFRFVLDLSGKNKVVTFAQEETSQ